MTMQKKGVKKMFFQKNLTMLMAGVACLAPPACAFSADTGNQKTAVPERTVAVMRFAVQSATTTDALALASKACIEEVFDLKPGAAADNDLTVDPLILTEISGELRRQLSRKMFVLEDPEIDAIPAGSLVITGCISKAEKGNAAERMIGFGWGASRLNAHVVVLSKADTSLVTVDSFDLHVKGRIVLPPAGPAGIVVHAARQPSQTLSADARKLADQVVKRLDDSMKLKEQAAITSR
jgi:hypothetical protein